MLGSFMGCLWYDKSYQTLKYAKQGNKIKQQFIKSLSAIIHPYLQICKYNLRKLEISHCQVHLNDPIIRSGRVLCQ